MSFLKKRNTKDYPIILIFSWEYFKEWHEKNFCDEFIYHLLIIINAMRDEANLVFLFLAPSKVKRCAYRFRLTCK